MHDAVVRWALSHGCPALPEGTTAGLPPPPPPPHLDDAAVAGEAGFDGIEAVGEAAAGGGPPASAGDDMPTLTADLLPSSYELLHEPN